MKAIIIDDETKSRETLQMLLEEYCGEIEVAGMAADIDEGILLINTHLPGLVFLDISMPGGDGFELLSRLPKIRFQVIFVTAYDHYGVQAVKSNAVDYLLKPVDAGELQAAVRKAISRADDKSRSDSFRIISGQFPDKPGHHSKIAIPAADGFIFVASSDIISLSAEGRYTRVNLTGGKKTILTTKNLKEYEAHLPASGFIRVHHAHIINLDHVRHYHRGEGGSVTMSDGSEVLISKRKKKDFLDRFFV